MLYRDVGVVNYLYGTLLLVWCSSKKHKVQKSCLLPLSYVVKCCCTKQLKYPALFAVVHKGRNNLGTIWSALDAGHSGT